MAAIESVSVFAPAKINLYLHVTGKRTDGYHLLDSLMVFAGIGDTVTAAPAPSLVLTIEGPFAEGLDAGSDNLVLKAARALQDATKCTKGAALTLTKRLPVASGIGGGSADAAATVKALCDLWDVELPEKELQDLALSLGADVPVCLKGTPSFVGGIGEELSPTPSLPPCWLVLVNPGVGVSTPAVFKARDGGFADPAPFDEAPESPERLAALLAQRRNDLEKPAQSIAPEIGAVLAALQNAGSCLLTRMSGSGATCFGVFANAEEAEAAVEHLLARNPHWWVAAAPLMR